MAFPSALPVLRERRGRLILAQRPSRRFALPLAGLGLLVIAAPGLPPVLAWTLLIPIALAALGIDTWIFDPGAKTMRRRFGIAFATRGWSLGFERVGGFFLETASPRDKREAYDGTDPRDLYAPLLGSSKPSWTSFGLRLDEGRDLPLIAAPPERARELAALARRISEACGIALERRDEP